MLQVLRWLFTVSLVCWGVAEAGLQLRGLLRSGRARSTEWGSLFVIVVGFVVGTKLAGLAARRLPGAHLPVPYPALLLVALVCIWLGAGFRLWAIHTLGRYFRGVVHVQEGHQVVRHGPYRLVRHPAYSGLLLGVVGIALVWANAVSWLAFVGCALLSILYRIRVEERVLLAALGAEYADYAGHTRRLVPGVW
jgi:protein-S-isoprenylcysteine O-methyltransferase Ste14